MRSSVRYDAERIVEEALAASTSRRRSPEEQAEITRRADAAQEALLILPGGFTVERRDAMYGGAWRGHTFVVFDGAGVPQVTASWAHAGGDLSDVPVVKWNEGHTTTLEHAVAQGVALVLAALDAQAHVPELAAAE